MKTGIVVISLLLLAACIMPVTAEEPKVKYSYLTFQAVDIMLEETGAVVTVDYSVDSGVQFLVIFLGSHDLRNKVLRAMNFEGATIRSADLNQAVLDVPSASLYYGDNTYWFPRHTFLVTVPKVTITTPQMTRELVMVHQTGDGIGHFARLAQQRR